MARLTLRVPDSLHKSLAERAKQEGVSMNQFLVFALSKIVAADDIARQESRYSVLLGRFPAQEAEDALQEILAERD